MFESYAKYEYFLAAGALFLAMLGMGITLRWSDFIRVFGRPWAIMLVLLAQYVLVPTIGLLITTTLGLPAGLTVGLVIITVMPSGTTSNVLTYLGRGNVALSIAATSVSTCLCLVLTPIMVQLLAADALPATVEMPFKQIVWEITLCLVLPLTIGMLVGHRLSNLRDQAAKWIIRASLVALAWIVIGSLGSGRIDVWQYGWQVPALLVGFIVAVLMAVEWGAIVAGFSRSDSLTMGIETSVRNANLAVVLIAKLFPAQATEMKEIGGGALYVALFYGGASLFIPLVTVLQNRQRVNRLAKE